MFTVNTEQNVNVINLDTGSKKGVKDGETVRAHSKKQETLSVLGGTSKKFLEH